VTVKRRFAPARLALALAAPALLTLLAFSAFSAPAVQAAPPGGLPAAPSGAGKAKGEVPIRIVADKMTYSQAGKSVTFEGNVEVKRENVNLWATTLTTYFAGKGKEDKIERIVAQGGVRMTMNDRKGTCGTLTYDVENGILILEGSPSLAEGQNTIKGEVIKFYMKDSRSEVIGGKSNRVEAVFVTPKGVGEP
jgi:lipopolysaccharide export system protein LptA